MRSPQAVFYTDDTGQVWTAVATFARSDTLADVTLIEKVDPVALGLANVVEAPSNATPGDPASRGKWQAPK